MHCPMISKYMCVRACVRACVSMCIRVCVCVCIAVRMRHRRMATGAPTISAASSCVERGATENAQGREEEEAEERAKDGRTIWQKFSKISSIGIVHSEISIALNFENVFLL